MIKLDIKLNAHDIFVFSMYHSYGGSMGLLNIILTLAVLYMLISSWAVSTLLTKVLLAMCILAFTVIQPLLLYVKASKQAKKPELNHDIHMELDEEKLDITQGDQHGCFPWTEIYKSSIKKDMIVLYLTAVRAYLIPARYWGDDKDKLIELIKSKTRVKRF